MRTSAWLPFVALALTPLSAGAASKPPTPNFAKAIDGFASYDAQDTCDPTAKPGAVSIRDFLIKTYPASGDYGITRACNIGGTSEHKEGRAFDWKLNYNNATQRDIAETTIDWWTDTDQHGNACAIARRQGIMYFIWNSKIWGAYRSPNSSCKTAGWKAYTGTNPHTDHVHISWSWAGAKKQTTWWTAAPPPEPPPPTNLKPKGYIDGADCDRVWGWAQDPDAPKKSIDAHVYFGGPAGDAKAKGVPLTADVDRKDLCTPLGSCTHGFEVASPLSLHDGKDHPVHAYGIDSAGGANAELSQSPKSLNCAPVIPSGVKRKVADATSFADWGFSEFWDVMPVTDSALGKVKDEAALPDAPLLVQADDGSPEVWLIDGELRRHVPNMDVFKTWGFDAAAIVKWKAADVKALAVGPKWREKPVLIRSGAEIYLMDDALPEPPSPSGSGGTSASSGGSGGVELGGSGGAGTGGSNANAPGQKTKLIQDDDASGCACRAPARAPNPAPATGLLALGALAMTSLRRRGARR